MSSYLELLDLTREPFSNSPDPDAYYRTPTHEDCLNRLEIAIRLRRGLNVVLGEVGTGKSTLCRCLLRTLGERDDIDVFLLLDAGFEDGVDFVRNLCSLFTGEQPDETLSRRDCINRIQSQVFDRALEQGRNLVLFVDEGQKIGTASLEVLRELLNFETNTEKLLQIVIFGQPELAQTIEGMPNFKDRINECLYLKPLVMRESIRMVRHRLRLAGGQKAERLFSLGSLMALHRASGGKPRQLMRLGHQMLLALIVGNRRVVTRGMVRAQVSRNRDGGGSHRLRWILALGLAGCLAGGYAWLPDAVKQAARSRLEALVTGIRGHVLPSSPKPDTPPSGPASMQPVPPAPAVSASPAAAASSAAPALLPGKAVPEKDVPAAAPAPGGAAELSAVPMDSVQDPQQDPPARSDVAPDSLGTFRLRPGESLAEVVRAFYGSGTALGLVEVRNPGYRTDAAAGEQTLDLPAVLYTPPAFLKKGRLLSLGEYRTPGEAYMALRSYGKRAGAVALVGVWRSGEGLRFHILVPKSFTGERAAWSWVSRFSPPAEAEVRMLPPFDDTCLVFHKFATK